ncbi:MAG: ChaN family lipoprotein [Planctomycetota bacterium]
MNALTGSPSPASARHGPPAAAVGVLCLVLGGCAAPGRHAETQIPADVRTALAIHQGQDGHRVPYPVLMEAVATADVIVIGEEHDDAVGHRVQQAIVEDALARWPDSALSMEMLDRRKQAVVDDYLADFIDLETFYERAGSTRWRKISLDYLEGKIKRKTFKQRVTKIGWPDWENNYQPMIDAAKEAGAPVVAANTPWRVYTTVARKEGYERLDDVTPAQAALFELPEEVLEGRYRERFWETMVGRAEGEEPPPPADDAEAGPMGMSSTHSALTDEQVLEMFRAQLVMDATMADSIAAASRAGAAKVVHLVGHFHCDFEGGLVQELRRRLPEARILVITLLSLDGAELGEDDIGRADFVVHTGYRRPG